MLFKYDVLCIGSATVDTFLEVKTPFKNIHLGDKVLVSSLVKHSGGGAINSAVACSKFGLKARVLTKLGRDHDGDFVSQRLNQYKIKNICRRPSKQNTDSSSVIDYSPDKDRIIYNHKGASLDLKEDDFKLGDLNVKWIYLATLMGASFETAKKIAKIAKQKKVSLLFNPSLYLTKKGKSYLKPILEAAKILVLNLEEAQALLNYKSSINPNSSRFKELLFALNALGPQTVVITNGSKKMYGMHQSQIYSLQPPKVKINHTAGAGDAFTAGMLSAIIKKYDFETALKLGQAEATSVIQDKGVAHNLLSEKEAVRIINRYKIKVNKE